MSASEPVLFVSMALLWAVLVGVFGRASYKAFKRQNKKEAIIMLIVTVTILLFSAQWIVFFVWAIGCAVGLPIGCMK